MTPEVVTTEHSPSSKKDEIKTMKLYSHLDRVENRLRSLGYSLDDEKCVDPELLATVDSLHYQGDAPIARIGALLPKRSNMDQRAVRVLDVGAGYGGTARVLAHRHGCCVDALELQPDLSAAAASLTQRCALSDRVQHLTGDFLSTTAVQGEYDALVGLLCFLHIGQWETLFKRCFDVLNAGGVVYVEDFFVRGKAFTTAEQVMLAKDVYCTQLLRLEELHALLTRIGFEIVALEDVTPQWVPHVTERLEHFHANMEQHITRDGKEATEALDHFYSSVATLFQGGNLGGYQLIARKPSHK